MSGKRRSRNKRETTRDKLLKWNKYYSSQRFGIGVECTSCKKWRLVYEYVEDIEVPEDWVCSMSVIDGQKGHCDLPTKYSSEYFVEEAFVPGSIVWAKCPMYPWWPAMVEDDPDCEEYHVKGDEDDDEEYHVVFFYETPSRKWVNIKNITAFVKPPSNMKELKIKRGMKKRLENAENKGKLAVTMSIPDRLNNFSFAVLSQAKFPKSKTNTEVPKIPGIQPETKEDEVPKILGLTKRKREVKATANQDLPIKKRKTVTASVPQTSQTPDIVTDVQITTVSDNITTSDSIVTSQALVPVNRTTESLTPNSPATAEIQTCEVPAIQEAMMHNCVGTSSNGTDAEDTSIDDTKLDNEDQTEDKRQLLSDGTRTPSPYAVSDNTKDKNMDELFNDIDSNDLFGIKRCLTPEVDENKYIITETGEVEKFIDTTPDEDLTFFWSR